MWVRFAICARHVASSKWVCINTHSMYADLLCCPVLPCAAAVVWDSVAAVSKAPADNKACLFSSLTRVMAVLQDTLREVRQLHFYLHSCTLGCWVHLLWLNACS